MTLQHRCQECRCTEDGNADTFCKDCWTKRVESETALTERVADLEKEIEELGALLTEAEEKLALEAEVYAAQIREKDALIAELLAKVHAA